MKDPVEIDLNRYLHEQEQPEPDDEGRRPHPYWTPQVARNAKRLAERRRKRK